MSGIIDGLGGWLPIETAPRDGKDMLLLFRPAASQWAKVAPGKFNVEEFARRPRPYWEIWLKIGGITESRAWEPTHWMPMPPPPAAGRCPRCGAEMAAGMAIESTVTGSPDFIGGEVVTLSPGGPGKLVVCMKCIDCGYSTT